MHQPRRLPVSLLLVLALVLSLAPPAAAQSDLVPAGVVIDGQRLQAEAYIVNGRTMVPLRAIFERLNATVEWDAATRTVTARKGTTIIKLVIDKTAALVDGKMVTLSVPAMLINGRTFVPLRFVSEALGAQVAFDNAQKLVTVSTGTACTLPGGQLHTGTVKAGGETWGLCGSPHIVSGEFRVEGPDSPYLVIEAGVLVQFEAGAGLTVGMDAPGGLLVQGKPGNPVVMTAATAGAQPGHWAGIRFGDQTVKGKAEIWYARIEYAGGTDSNSGAIYLEGENRLVQVLLQAVEIRHSQYAGINLYGTARLDEHSSIASITGTRAAAGNGGFPFVTDAYGSHNLPQGDYRDNDINAVYLVGSGTDVQVTSHITWKNIGIPYAAASSVRVEGIANPQLMIRPGVVVLFAQGHGLIVGEEHPGALVAEAFSPSDPTLVPVDRGMLTGSLPLATGAIALGRGTYGSQPIVFGAWSHSPTPGSWEGIRFYGKAGQESRLSGVVVAFAGSDNTSYGAGIYAQAEEGAGVQLHLSHSLVTRSARSGVQLEGSVTFAPDSRLNYITNNAWPVQLPPGSAGSLPLENDLTGNQHNAILVAGDAVRETQTWSDHGVPYVMEETLVVGGPARPVLTIAPGTELHFGADAVLEVAAGGALRSVGAAGRPIQFAGITPGSGMWRGITFGAGAQPASAIEYTVIMGAQTGVTLEFDLGPFIRNTTFSDNQDYGIYRGYDTESGTDFLTGLGNQFDGNGEDQNP